MPAAVLFLAVLLVGVLAPFVLYWLVRAEHRQRDRMSREEAEREARRDVPDDR